MMSNKIFNLSIPHEEYSGQSNFNFQFSGIHLMMFDKKISLKSIDDIICFT